VGVAAVRTLTAMMAMRVKATRTLASIAYHLTTVYGWLRDPYKFSLFFNPLSLINPPVRLGHTVSVVE